MTTAAKLREELVEDFGFMLAKKFGLPSAFEHRLDALLLATHNEAVEMAAGAVEANLNWVMNREGRTPQNSIRALKKEFKP